VVDKKKSTKPDLRISNPEIFAQLSDPLSVEGVYISPKSNRKYQWRCLRNSEHLWFASVFSRVEGTGCPFCAGKKVMTRVNDLESRNPKLVAEWHERNLLKPSEVTSGSQKRVWWRCSKFPEHEWEAVINSRNKGSGCPYCSNTKLLVGYNDLGTLHPSIAKLWHPSKNGITRPSDVIGASGKKFWFQCPENNQHYWQSSPNRLVTQGAGCPICSNRKLASGQNDLATLNPALSQEWAEDLNGIGASVVHAGSHSVYWWRCSMQPSHLWQTSPQKRKQGQGCPYCSNKRVAPGFNDLKSFFPSIADEWDFEANEGISPSQVSKKSHRKVSWVCSSDPRHKWVATVASRAAGNGCPACKGRLTIKGVNDLATLFPELVDEWHPTLNTRPTPGLLSPGSRERVWWGCRKFVDHAWEAAVSSRTRMGSGCPICANLRVKSGFNDLATIRPDVAKTWHPKKNGQLRPDQFVSGTNEMIWWQCPSVASHVWRASVKNRTTGRGCPDCAPAGYSTGQPGFLYLIKHSQLMAKKIGITNTSLEKGRVNKFKSLGWDVIRIWRYEDGIIPMAAETRILRWLRQDLGLPVYLSPKEMGQMGGWSETFSFDGISDEDLINQCVMVLSEEEKRVEST
jgi:hypothetical protein